MQVVGSQVLLQYVEFRCSTRVYCRPKKRFPCLASPHHQLFISTLSIMYSGSQKNRYPSGHTLILVNLLEVQTQTADCCQIQSWRSSSKKNPGCCGPPQTDPQKQSHQMTCSCLLVPLVQQHELLVYLVYADQDQDQGSTCLRGLDARAVRLGHVGRHYGC